MQCHGLKKKQKAISLLAGRVQIGAVQRLENEGDSSETCCNLSSIAMKGKSEVDELCPRKYITHMK